MKPMLLRWLAAAGSSGLVVGGLFAYRVAERGASQLAESDRAFDAGRADAAVEHAWRAASAYLPGAAHVRLAHERLWAVARGAERARDPELARQALRSLRAALIETRHLWQPHATELRAVQAELARLGERTPAAAPASSRASSRAALGLVGGAVAALAGLAWLCGGDGLEGARSRPWLAALVCVLGVALWSGVLLGW